MITNLNSARSGRRARARLLGFSAMSLALAAIAPARALAADATPAPVSDVSEVVVNGVPYRETVLPTRLPDSSTYGINLSVMDTPRNTTLLSTTQLETLNLNDPRAFSYLTSSSYTDAAFGTPNIPRVRTQYADVFYNGMRDSLTQNGYGVPINFDAFANIALVCQLQRPSRVRRSASMTSSGAVLRSGISNVSCRGSVMARSLGDPRGPLSGSRGGVRSRS